MWQVAQLMLVFFRSVKNSIWPRRRSRCAVSLPNAPGNERVAATVIAAGLAGLTSTVAIEVVNWFTTQSVLPSSASAMPRGPLWIPTGLLSAQQRTGIPSTRAGQPEQSASVVHAVPGLDVNPAHTFAPKLPVRLVLSASVGTVASVGSGSATCASSAGDPAASAARSSTSTTPLAWHVT